MPSRIPRKLQLLAELLSEEQVLQLIAEQLGQFVVIGPTEPAKGPALWFDTAREVSEPETAIYLRLGTPGDESEVVLMVDGLEYPVINTESPLLADNGDVNITISE